jgi:hydroxymethylbilane synthase
MSTLNKISVGIRDSKLSRAQTDILLNQLISDSDNMRNEAFDIKTIKTKGDIHNIQRLDQIGGKGLFIKEIEQHIINGQVDVGIHSMKDVPAEESSNELEIICWLKRENPGEALLTNSGRNFFDLPSGSVIGTSSIRRRAQILNLRRDLRIKLLRGNVDTRIKKLRENNYDAIILSLAGLKRLGLLDHVTEELDKEQFLPAACQGTVGVQSKFGSELKKVFATINHYETEIESLTERYVLKKINANCNSPVSVYAKIADNMIAVQCDIFDHDGIKLFSEIISDEKDNYIKIGNTLAKTILNDLGQEKINKLNELNDFDYSPST